jgi:hypothetical protein
MLTEKELDRLAAKIALLLNPSLCREGSFAENVSRLEALMGDCNVSPCSALHLAHPEPTSRA